METPADIPAPLLFNPLKHHAGYIKTFISENPDKTGSLRNPEIVKELRHIGGSVMDLYTGNLSYREVCDEFMCILKTKNLSSPEKIASFAGTGKNDFKTLHLTDGSRWVVKYNDHPQRFVHIFPARYSPLSIRIKANTLKSAILYQIYIGKDMVTDEDLNTARAIANLSPVRDIFDAEAISEMIEILRS